MSNIIEFRAKGQFGHRPKNSNQAKCTCWRIIVHEANRKVLCADCGATVNAFNWLSRVAHNEVRWKREAADNRKKAEAAYVELKRLERDIADRAWQLQELKAALVESLTELRRTDAL